MVPEDAPNATDEAAAFSPPYIAYQTLENVLERMRAEGIPSRVDRSYLSSWSGSSQAQFLRAARSLGLLDPAGKPSQRLVSLVKNPDQRPVLVRAMIEENYSDALALGTNATQQQLEEVFRAYPGISGGTVRKAIAFYMHAARAAEIQLSPHFRAVRTSGSTGAAKQASATRRNQRRNKGTGATASKETRPEDEEKEKSLSTDDPKQRYIDLLLKKAAEEMDDKLLDRIERVIGVESPGEPA
jgi:hypothetical protein